MAFYFPQDSFLSLENIDNNTGSKDEDFIIENSQEIADPFFSKNFIKSAEEKQWIDVTNPRFINWMVS